MLLIPNVLPSSDCRHCIFLYFCFFPFSFGLGWAKRDWLRGGACNFTPMSGFVQLLNINSQNRHEVGHQSSACAQQFQRTKKLTADSLRFANNVHLTERFNRGPISRRSARGWRKVDSKSTSTHVLLPPMSSIALETRAVHSR